MKEFFDRFYILINNNAPKLRELLNPPAVEQDFLKLEKELDINLTQDFKNAYLIHNGQEEYEGQLFDGEEWLSLNRILSEWNIWKELLDNQTFEDNGEPYISLPQKGIKSDWWNKKWIPFTSDGSGNHICLDLDPTEKGNYGQIIRVWHDDATRELLANSFQEWFEDYIQKLEQGDYEYDEESGSIIEE